MSQSERDLHIVVAMGGRQTGDRLCQMWVRLAAILMVLPLSFPTVLAVQQESGTAERLNLGFDQSIPGDVAFIAIMFSTAGEVEIGRIITEITFPRQLLSFEEARKGLPIKSIDAELSTQVRNDDPESENSILEVVIASKAGEAIPAGTLVNLTFMISPEAPTLHTIVLENRSVAFTTDDPPERVELTTTDGEIESLDIPALFACFFYMH